MNTNVSKHHVLHPCLWQPKFIWSRRFVFSDCISSSVGIYTPEPLKINGWNTIIEVWFKSFSFLFIGDGCRFQPLIFQGGFRLFKSTTAPRRLWSLGAMKVASTVLRISCRLYTSLAKFTLGALVDVPGSLRSTTVVSRCRSIVTATYNRVS